MKSFFRPLAVLGLVTAFTVTAQAGAVGEKTAVPMGKKRAAIAAAIAPAIPNASSVELLREAYGLLHRADHDYKGHRARAMHQIEEAAKFFGVNLRGQGKGDEKQGTSDSQVREAQSALERSIGGLAGKPLHHVREAISQLTIALNVR
ncbi:MAG TPA: hypothetical protein VFC44_10280 [Candidatus Saccharimonadales bacterium]|nr:hypothetical protein [Candidatus Saccharimonadales bacterium]